jgi:hypothetical protein
MGEVIFDGNVEEWESVDQGPEDADYNDYPLEFVDMDEVEEGDYWIGEFTGIREIGGVENAIFDNDEEEVSYAFTPHTILRNQLEEVEKGDVVAVVFEGVYEESNQPNKPYLWDVRVPPE